MNDHPPSNPSIEAWDDWFCSCAIRRCSTDHRAELEEYARIRFTKAAHIELKSAAKQIIRDVIGFRDVENTHCFSLFEVYSQTNPKKALNSSNHEPSKLYKERLKEIRNSPTTGDPALDLAQYASSFFQPAVRQSFIAEIPLSREIVPSQATVPGTDDLTLEDLIHGKNTGQSVRKEHPIEPDKAGEDLEIFSQAAATIFESWDQRERFGQWAKINGISTDNPVLHQRVGRGKDAIWNAQKSAKAKADHSMSGILAKYPGEDRSLVRNQVGEILVSYLKRWAESENLHRKDFD